MLPVEEAIYKILGKTELENPGVDQNALRNILEGVLYEYNIEPQTRELALLNDMMDKVILYLSIKKLEGLSNATIDLYKSHLIRFSSAMQRDVTQVTVMDCRVYLARLQKDRDIKPTTLNTEISILKGFFSWLVDSEFLLRSPMKQIKNVKTEKRLRKSLEHEDIEKLRIACKTLRQRAILEFIYATGCRVSEVVGVNIKDISFGDMTLKVIGKGNKERYVYFNEKTRIYVKRYIEMDRGIHKENDALFINSKKPYNRLGKRSIEKEMDIIAKAAGFDKAVYPHLLRHTMATHALKAGVPLPAIQQMLGHTDPSTTQIYAETDETSVREEYRKHMVQ